MGKRKKGAYRYGKAVSFDFRVRHPVVHKPPKNGVAESIPITHSEGGENHKHIRLPKPFRTGGGWIKSGKDGRPSYAVDRVIREKQQNLSKPLPSRISKANNNVFRKIFKRHKAKKKG
jgi:hypothetical protein